MIAHLVAQVHTQMLALEHVHLAQQVHLVQIQELEFVYPVLQELSQQRRVKIRHQLVQLVLQIFLVFLVHHLVFHVLLVQPFFQLLLVVPLLTILSRKFLVCNLMVFYSLEMYKLQEVFLIQLTNLVQQLQQ